MAHRCPGPRTSHSAQLLPHFGRAKTRQLVHLSRLVHSRSARKPERSKRAQAGPPRSCEVLPTSSFKRRGRNPHSGLEALRSPRLRVSPSSTCIAPVNLQRILSTDGRHIRSRTKGTAPAISMRASMSCRVACRTGRAQAQNKRAMKASPAPAAIAFAEVSSRTKSVFSWAIPTKT